MIRNSVYPPELSLCELKTAETLLVTTVRLFLFAPDTPDPERPCWWEGLWWATGDLKAATAIEQFLRVITTASQRALDLRCPCSTELGEDEGRFLQIIALFQNRRANAALELLSDWLPPAAARLACAPAGDLAQLLARHRLMVPWRCPQDFVNMAIRGHSDPGLALVQ